MVLMAFVRSSTVTEVMPASLRAFSISVVVSELAVMFEMSSYRRKGLDGSRISKAVDHLREGNIGCSRYLSWHLCNPIPP